MKAESVYQDPNVRRAIAITSLSFTVGFLALFFLVRLFYQRLTRSTGTPATQGESTPLLHHCVSARDDLQHHLQKGSGTEDVPLTPPPLTAFRASQSNIGADDTGYVEVQVRHDRRTEPPLGQQRRTINGSSGSPGDQIPPHEARGGLTASQRGSLGGESLTPRPGERDGEEMQEEPRKRAAASRVTPSYGSTGAHGHMATKSAKAVEADSGLAPYASVGASSQALSLSAAPGRAVMTDGFVTPTHTTAQTPHPSPLAPTPVDVCSCEDAARETILVQEALERTRLMHAHESCLLHRTQTCKEALESELADLETYRMQFEEVFMPTMFNDMRSMAEELQQVESDMLTSVNHAQKKLREAQASGLAQENALLSRISVYAAQIKYTSNPPSSASTPRPGRHSGPPTPRPASVAAASTAEE